MSEDRRLRAGDYLSMVLDRPNVFRKPARKAARNAVVITAEPTPRR